MSAHTAERIRLKIHSLMPVKDANFWFHIIEGVFFSFGAALVQGPVLPFIYESLGVKPAMFGFLGMFHGLAVLLPIFLSPRIEASPRKKRLVWMLGLGQRLPFLVIPFLLLFYAAAMPMATAIMIASVNFIASLLVSILIAPWMTLVAETIGQDRVGHLFGYRQGMTSIFKLVSAGACVWLLSMYVFPRNYAILYFAALASVVISWFVFGLVHEVPRDSVPAEPKKMRPYFKELFNSIKGNLDFRWLLVYRAINRLGFAAMPFYAFTARSVFKAPDSYAGWFMGVTAVAQTIGCFSLPYIGGKIGHKRMLGLGSLLHVMAMLLAAFAPSLNWFFAVIFMSGLGMASLTVSGAAFMLEMAPRKRRVGYFNMMMATMAPVGMAASASAGIVMATFSHTWLFVVTAAIIFLGLIPLERCNPQRARLLAEADDGPQEKSKGED